jgi:hypothetical protein
MDAGPQRPYSNIKVAVSMKWQVAALCACISIAAPAAAQAQSASSVAATIAFTNKQTEAVRFAPVGCPATVSPSFPTSVPSNGTFTVTAATTGAFTCHFTYETVTTRKSCTFRVTRTQKVTMVGTTWNYPVIVINNASNTSCTGRVTSYNDTAGNFSVALEHK